MARDTIDSPSAAAAAAAAAAGARLATTRPRLAAAAATTTTTTSAAAAATSPTLVKFVEIAGLDVYVSRVDGGVNDAGCDSAKQRGEQGDCVESHRDCSCVVCV